jgi:hypothetical protein
MRLIASFFAALWGRAFSPPPGFRPAWSTHDRSPRRLESRRRCSLTVAVLAAERDWRLARPERLELPTYWFEANRSIQLSYGRAL